MTANKYTLTYFESPGRAETIRLALSAVGADFKDVRVKPEEWPKMKESTPQGHLPTLDVEYPNGKKKTFHQSNALYRFVAREHGLYGDDNIDMTMVDVVMGTVDDIFSEIIKWFLEQDETKKAEIKAELGKTVIPKFVKYFADIKGDKEWMVGSKLTIADIATFNLFDQLPVTFGDEIIESYRNNESLQAHAKAVLKNKGIQKWLEDHPKPKKSGKRMAATKYTITYFDSPGRAETTRLALSAAGVEFNDVRVTPEEWQKMKQDMPQGQLPIMEVEFAGGRKTTFCQSGAMYRFVGREHGLYGDTNEDMTMVDVVMGTLEDIFYELIKVFMEKDETKKAEIKAELGKTVIPKFVKYLANIKSDKEWMVGSKLTIADIAVFSLFDQLPVMFGEEIIEAYRNNESLQAHAKTVLTNKGIRKWIDTRPKPKKPE
ncbi:uncharacterized protein [Argopecten irradians]|uniref:uncharacterized protein n=1 Tax=Argopecten irradians TaxID=31199 RepID=UPI00371045A1